MSLRLPSQVSPTTGSSSVRSAAISASRTTPTLQVLVSPTGVDSRPDSRTHSSPVSSPLPLRVWQPAKTGSLPGLPPWGRTTVTPVRTSSLSIRVVWPTRTPPTSVIASAGPEASGPISTPSSRARIRAV